MDRLLRAVPAAVGLGLALPASALAHGAEVPPAPDAATFLAWSADPTVLVPLLVSLVLFLWLVRRVDRAHPASPVPRRRVLAFLGALAAVLLALQSPIERYDTTLFSVHMLQHILLMFVAAPLLALSAPITLLLRAADGRTRTRILLPILHSRFLKVLAFPVVSWAIFAGVMWGSHFSPLFDAALEDPLVHDLEHLLFLGAAILFWWPALAVDPVPWRMPYPARIAYLFLQMPQNTFLSVAIYGASAPLYAHYATLGRAWGPSVLADQQAAGALMWVLGDVAFLAAVLGVVVVWLRSEERDAVRREARVDVERAAIRERERRLAERRRLEAAEAMEATEAAEARPEGTGGAGDGP